MISQAVALVPFSHTSSGSGLAGLDQEQLTHWNPSGLFWRSSARLPLANTPSRLNMSATERAEPQPPDGASYGLNDTECGMVAPPGWLRHGQNTKPPGGVPTRSGNHRAPSELGPSHSRRADPMVTAAYMTERPPPPSALKRVWDQDVIPAGINLAGAVEGALWRASERARSKPWEAMLAALACGYLLRGVLRRL